MFLHTIIFTSLAFSLITFGGSEILASSGNKAEKSGKHITSHGNMYALFLFVQFDNDSTTNSEGWPYDTLNLPEWANYFVDSKIDTSFPHHNLSHYFYEMSNGKFQLTGFTYPKLIRPQFDEDHYKNIGEVNTEILTRLDDEIDYSKFDNWGKDRRKQFAAQTDSTVDLIFIIYRNFSDRLFFNNGWTGSALLYLEKEFKTNDSMLIKGGKMKSGLQLRGGKHGYDYTKYIAAHEFGHFLFGAIHIPGGNSNLALMPGGPAWNASRGMHSWEREKLGWIEYIDVNTSCDSIYTIDDYMTTGDVLRLQLSGSEWFLVENRQKISPHDKACDKGIYIYHVTRANSIVPIIDVECADGNWNFEIDTTAKTLKRIALNPNGIDEMSFVKFVGGEKIACFTPVYYENAAWGDDEDAFDLNYNNVFSPVSNPPSTNKTGMNITIEVIEKKDNKYSLQFFVEDPFAGKPSKPHGLSVQLDSISQITLSWLPNKEPDIECYNIYVSSGKEKINNDFRLIESVSALNDSGLETSSWMDSNYNVLNEKINTCYAIRAIDKDGNESVMSECVMIDDIKKLNEVSEEKNE